MNLNEKEKSYLFDRLFTSRYEQLVRINLVTGQAENIYTKRPEWDRVGVKYSYEDAVERLLLDRCADPDPDSVIRPLKLPAICQGLDRKEIYSVPVPVRTGGKKLLMKRIMFVADEDVSVIGMVEDITEPFLEVADITRRLEQEVDKTRQSLDERTEFLRLMSHHLREPLYSIMGLTRIAQDEINGIRDSAAFDAYLHKISMSGTYMSETIDDVLDMRRISRGELELHAEPVLLSEVLSRVNDLIHPVLEEKGLLFSINADMVFSLRVETDPHAFQQVLAKGIRSAMSYAVRGSRIALNVRELYRNQGAVSLEFSFESKGIIIDQERLQSIFRPYDYLTEKIDVDLGALDMDMIIFKSYLLAMGTDTIIAESDEARGTRVTVRITLPLVPEDSPQEEEAEAPPDFTGVRVLLVDDNGINLEVGEKILREWGVDVVTAVNGQEAIEKFYAAHGNFDLVLMDILMPEMDGYMAARRIRAMSEMSEAHNVPIVAMTANAFRENYEESFSEGMDGHLVKPVEPERLRRVIEEALSRR
ncbi:MAG: response regulator [Eubacterium sp.]|nr:response regulator [Eubacterium sp.]